MPSTTGSPVAVGRLQDSRAGNLPGNTRVTMLGFSCLLCAEFVISLERQHQSRCVSLGILRCSAIRRRHALHADAVTLQTLGPSMRFRGTLSVDGCAVNFYDHQDALEDDNEVGLESTRRAPASDEHRQRREVDTLPFQRGIQVNLRLTTKKQPVVLSRRNIIASYAPLVVDAFASVL